MPGANVIPLKQNADAPKTIEQEFDALWSIWLPRRRGGRSVKAGKGYARKCYMKARTKASYEDIREGLEQFRANPPEPEFVPDFSTWLNREQWDDEYESERRQEMRDATPEEAARYYREQGRDRLADLCLSDQRPEWLSLKVPAGDHR